MKSNKRALIVVDYQNDFVDGSLGFPGAETLEQPILHRVREAIARGEDVLVTYDTHAEDYLQTQEGRKLPVVHGLKGTQGWQLYGALQEALADAKSFCKNTFGSMELANYLQQQAYDVVELCGLVSNMCVLSNAVLAKAALPEAEIIIDERLTKGFDPQLHAKAMDVLEGIQMTVLREK